MPNYGIKSEKNKKNKTNKQKKKNRWINSILQKNHLQSAQLKGKYLSHTWKIKYITLKYKAKWIA